MDRKLLWRRSHDNIGVRFNRETRTRQTLEIRWQFQSHRQALARSESAPKWECSAGVDYTTLIGILRNIVILKQPLINASLIINLFFKC